MSEFGWVWGPDTTWETYDASDAVWTPVSGAEVFEIRFYVPRPEWQRRLSWLIPSWRHWKQIAKR